MFLKIFQHGKKKSGKTSSDHFLFNLIHHFIQKNYGTERYITTVLVPIGLPPDFTNVLKKNVLGRFNEMIKVPSSGRIPQIAHGDNAYNTEWAKLMAYVTEYAENKRRLWVTVMVCVVIIN